MSFDDKDLYDSRNPALEITRKCKVTYIATMTVSVKCRADATEEEVELLAKEAAYGLDIDDIEILD